MTKFTPKTTVYLASPFTYRTNIPFLRGFVEFLRFLKISKVAGTLEALYPGHAFILPITMSYITQKLHPTLGGEFEAWAHTDYTYIAQCKEVWVVMMPGWNRSVGVLAEIKFAKQRKKAIRYFDPDTLQELVGFGKKVLQDSML